MNGRMVLAVVLTMFEGGHLLAQQELPARWGPAKGRIQRQAMPQKDKLPPSVRAALLWLPERTESVQVAVGSPRSSVKSPDFHRRCFESNVGSLKAHLPKHVFETFIDPEHVEVTVSGAYGFDDGEFRIPGGATYVGCSIVFFSRNLAGSALKALMDADGPQRKVNRVGRIVEVQHMKTRLRAYLAKMDERALVIANDRGVLETMMLRAKTRPVSQSFPPELDQWQHVNTAAPAWGLRHYRKECAKPNLMSMVMYDARAIGIAFWYDPKRKVVALRYLSRSPDSAAKFAQLWNDVVGGRFTPQAAGQGAVRLDVPICVEGHQAGEWKGQLSAFEACVIVGCLMGYTVFP